MSKNSFGARRIVFCAACIAVATVIANFIKLPSLPFGGSATLLSMLFVALPGYLFGLPTGLAAGVAHGIIQLISNPYVVHPVQVLFDYPLAFGALGLSGLFASRKHGLILGYTAGVLGRFLMVNISGLIFFTSYTSLAGENLLAVWSSISYNVSYIVPEYVITIVLLAVPPVSNAFRYIKKIALAN